MTVHTDPAHQSALTEDDHGTIRRAAFGAIALVSKADPGFFAMFKESMAGSKAFQEAPEAVQALLREGGFPTPPTGSPEQVEQAVLSDLSASVQLLQAKSPTQAAGFRDVILEAADRVANASDGVAPQEQAIIDKIRGALGSGVAHEPAESSAPQERADQSSPATGGALDDQR